MNAEDKLLFAMRDYLDSKGWTALVGSVDRIQQKPGESLNFELVLQFTGAKRDTSEPSPGAKP